MGVLAFGSRREKPRSILDRVPSCSGFSPRSSKCAWSACCRFRLEATPITGLPVAPEVATAIEAWLAWLDGERRLAANTLEAYRCDLRGLP